MALRRTLRVYQNISGLGRALKLIEIVARLNKENTRQAKILRSKMRRLQQRGRARRARGA